MRQHYTLFLACCIGFVLTYLCHWPGRLSPDSWFQFCQSVTGDYTSHHPPVMAMVWSLLHKLTGTPTTWSMLLLQLLLGWGGIYLIGSYLIRQNLRLNFIIPWPVEIKTQHSAENAQKTYGIACFPRSVAGWILLFILFFSPPIFIYVGILWKDVQLAYAWMLAVGSLLLVPFLSYRSVRWLLICLAFVALTYGFLVRPHGVFGLIPLLFYGVLVASGKWQAANKEDTQTDEPAARRPVAGIGKPVLITIVLTALIVPLYPLSNQFCADKDTPLSFSLFFDIVGVSLMTGTDYCPDFIRELPGYDIEKFRSKINYNAAHVFAAGVPGSLMLAKTRTKDMFKTWLYVARKEPVAFAKQRLKSLNAILKFRKPDPQHRLVQEWHVHQYMNSSGVSVPEARPIPYMGTWPTRYVLRLTRPVFFKPYLICLLAVWGCVAMCHYRGNNQLKWLCGLLFLSALLYVFTNLLVYGAHDFRYVYWTYLASGIAMILLLLDSLNASKPVLSLRMWWSLPVILSVFYFMDV